MTAVLELTGVSCTFGGIRALDEVSLCVAGGTVHAVIGPNGAGKTTLLNVVAGAVRASHGTVMFHGKRIDRLRPAQVAARGVIRTFQTPQLATGASVREALAIGGHRLGRGGMLSALLGGRRAAREEAALAARTDAVLEELDLHAVAARPVDALPPAVRRRVELGRALAAEPALLLLDEPAAGMSTREAADFGAQLRSLAGRDMTVVIIEHNMELVLGTCDAVTVLDRGRVISSGLPDVVRRDRHVTGAYLGGGVA